MSELEATGEGTLIAPSEPATTSAWYGEEFAETVEKKGWKEPTDVLKSYTELEKMASGRVKMPTPESSAEEIRAFYQRTGCPENPDGYEIQVPEEASMFRDEASEAELRAIAHEMGVSKQAFEAIAAKYYDNMVMGLQKSRESGEASLKEEFGDKYDENLSIAQRFAGNCSEEFRSLMETSGLGNNPVVIKEFINLGKKTMSDTLVKGETDNPDEKGYVPRFKDSPGMYATGEDEESQKARAYFEARGHKY